jgi:hypothetical protein
MFTNLILEVPFEAFGGLKVWHYKETFWYYFPTVWYCGLKKVGNPGRMWTYPSGKNVNASSIVAHAK